MTPSTQSLLEASSKFDDTEELANALLDIANDEAMSPTIVYYLKESAIHMQALHSEYLTALRCLKPNAHMTTTRYRPDTAKFDFSKESSWTAEDYLYLLYLHECVHRKNKTTAQIIQHDFGVTIGKARTLDDKLSERYDGRPLEFVLSALELKFKEPA
jgi:hypothetical protein